MDLIKLTNVIKNIDERGYLIEFLRDDENMLDFKGQIYVSLFEPYTKRGDHYHKKRYEIFSVIKGELVLHTLNLDTEKKHKIELSSENDYLQRIMIPPMTAHTFVNSSQKSILISYTNLVYDKSNTDTYKYNISI